MGQHILVAVDRVLRHGESSQFGEELIDQPGLDEAPQGRAGIRANNELRELVTYSFSRHDGQPIGHLARRLDGGLIRGEPEGCLEPEQPQHPERVVVE